MEMRIDECMLPRCPALRNATPNSTTYQLKSVRLSSLNFLIYFSSSSVTFDLLQYEFSELKDQSSEMETASMYFFCKRTRSNLLFCGF